MSTHTKCTLPLSKPTVSLYHQQPATASTAAYSLQEERGSRDACVRVCVCAHMCGEAAVQTGAEMQVRSDVARARRHLHHAHACTIRLRVPVSSSVYSDMQNHITSPASVNKAAPRGANLGTESRMCCFLQEPSGAQQHLVERCRRLAGTRTASL